MTREQAWGRAVGIIVAVIVNWAGVQEAHAAEGVRQRDELGFVLQMQGSWVDRASGKHLRVGDRIYADSQLAREAAQATDDLIAVTFHGVSKPVTFACKDGSTCRASIVPSHLWQQQKPPELQRDYGSMLRVIRQFFAKDAPNYVVTLTPPQRRQRSKRLFGLARLEGEILDLADLLEPYGARTQLPEPLESKKALQAEFCPVTDTGLVQCPTSPIALHPLPWANSAPRQVAAPGLQPGLYLLIVCSTSGTHLIRSDVRVLVLVLPAERLAMAAEEWRHMREAISAASDQDLMPELLVAGLVSLRRAWLP